MSHTAADIFDALAHPTRRRILHILSAGPLAAGQIAQRFRLCRPAISKHLALLKRAGLLVERRQAQRRLYAIRPESLIPVAIFLEGLRPRTRPEQADRRPGPPSVQAVNEQPAARGSAEFDLEFD